jgi:hypothetical protein
MMNNHNIGELQDVVEEQQILHLWLYTTSGTPNHNGIYSSISLLKHEYDT